MHCIASAFQGSCGKPLAAYSRNLKQQTGTLDGSRESLCASRIKKKKRKKYIEINNKIQHSKSKQKTMSTVCKHKATPSK